MGAIAHRTRLDLGPERNDQLKHHPCLVPYEELPEVEKAYDRDTAVDTLKLISRKELALQALQYQMQKE